LSLENLYLGGYPFFCKIIYSVTTHTTVIFIGPIIFIRETIFPKASILSVTNSPKEITSNRGRNMITIQTDIINMVTNTFLAN